MDNQFDETALQLVRKLTEVEDARVLSVLADMEAGTSWLVDYRWLTVPLIASGVAVLAIVTFMDGDKPVGDGILASWPDQTSSSMLLEPANKAVPSLGVVAGTEIARLRSLGMMFSRRSAEQPQSLVAH